MHLRYFLSFGLLNYVNVKHFYTFRHTGEFEKLRQLLNSILVYIFK